MQAAEVNVASRADEELQATEVKVAGRADKASAAALGIEDSSISVHWGLGLGTSGNEVRLSQSRGDGKLQMVEVNVAGPADKASAAALGIGDSRITVHCGLGSEASGKEMSLSSPGGDGRWQMAELNSVVSADEAIGWRQRLLLHSLLCWRQQ